VFEARITREVGVLAASATQLQSNAAASRTGLTIQAHPVAAFTALAALAFSVSKPWTVGRYFVMNHLSY
jgi:hypothetical protein